MNWYVTKLIYRIISGEGEHAPQFDEQLRLVKAEDSFHAFQKAQRMGHQNQEAFYNSRQQLVQWQFVDVSEINQLNELTDGTEVYSRINEVEDADIYMKTVRLKAKHLCEDSLEQAFQNH